MTNESSDLSQPKDISGGEKAVLGEGKAPQSEEQKARVFRTNKKMLSAPRQARTSVNTI